MPVKPLHLNSVRGFDPMILTTRTIVTSKEYARIEAMIKLMAMTVHGLELAIGAQSAAVLGSYMGMKLYETVKPKGSLRDALEEVNRRSFRIDVYKYKGRLVLEEDGQKVFYLIGRECPIRQILYHEDLPAAGTLCRVMCSFLERLLADKLGGKYVVRLKRYGPNACFIRVRIVSGPEPSEDLEVYSKKPSLEEYVKLLEDDLRLIMHAFDETVERVLGGNPTMSYMAGKRYGLLDGDNLLTHIGGTVELKEALNIFNAAYRDLLHVERRDDTLEITESLFHDIVTELGLKRALFVYRSVQGYIAGVLEALTGKRIDLRALDDTARRLKLVVH